MGLLKDFLRIDADRRASLAALRLDSQSRRLQIEELGAEAKRKRDEIGMLEEALRRLASEHHEALWGTQPFYRVFSLVNGGRGREHDLFEGLDQGPRPD